MIEYGVAYFSIAFPLIPLFFVIMKAIQLKCRESPNITYILMNMVNFCQLGQAFSHSISGPMLLLPQLLIKLDVIVRIIGCVMNSLWIADFPLMTLLAVTRILIFSNVIGSKRFPILIKLILCSIITWALFLIIVGSFTQNFFLVTPGWDYDFTVSNAEIFATLEVIISFACLALSYVSYILMVYLIYAKKNTVGCVQSRKNEISILLQSTFVTTYITIMIFIWHQSLFSMVSFIDMDNQRNQAILNFCLILHCYVNPILTLVCNKSIRNEFLKLLGIRKGKPYNNGVVSKLSSIHPTETSPS
ncbi:CRE-SRT-70 protein [Caenorhabditis remanei]|uniref:CRE-SRT-70 protein n=1 Tax=Caenorhabditis remanei TaxID=31234 RepID=E3LP44_CAERE|nr:CRE-SRT-70 protein [Caenorhabditis remanei]